MSHNHYIIDSSSLITLNRHTPMDVFPSVWRNIMHLIHRNYLHSPKEVYRELTHKDDLLAAWVKQHFKIFIPENHAQVEIVRDIMQRFPALLDLTKSFCADPWVIALAYDESNKKVQKTIYDEKVIVVTEERLRGEKVRIPYVCNHYNIECINLVEMQRQEGWQY